MLPRQSGLARAALRHLRCADHLSGVKEENEACYLIGLAAECGLKHHFQIGGLMKRRRAERRAELGKDVNYLHFPELAAEILTRSEGVLSGRVTSAAASFSQGWTIKMRYMDARSDRHAIAKFKEWKAETLALFEELGLR